MTRQLAITVTLLAAMAAQADIEHGIYVDFEYPPADWASHFTTDYNPGFIPTLPQVNPANVNALDGPGRLTINTSPYHLAPDWPSFSSSPNLPGTQFLIVNGSLEPGQVIWNLAPARHVPVMAGSVYFFEAYFANINQEAGNLGTLTFQLQFSPDNVTFGPAEVLGTPDAWAIGVGVWNIVTAPSWVAPANGYVDLQIVNANTQSIGNDFVIDNIGFWTMLWPPVIPEVSGMLPALVVLGLGGLFTACRKRRRETACPVIQPGRDEG